MSAPKIVCVGSNIESDIALRGLVNHGANIVGLVTRPTGERGSICDYVDMHEYCHQHHIATVDTLDINSATTLDTIRKLSPDFIFTLGTSQLFREELLNLPSGFVIGSHPSMLPEGRGRAPIPWTILQDLRRSAVSFFRMDIGADTGDLLLQRPFDIPVGSYAMEVYQLVSEHLRDGFCDLYDSIVSNTLNPIAQNAKRSSYRSRRGPSDGLINFSQSAVSIDRLIRAVSHPYPGAYLYYEDQKIEVWRASMANVPNTYGTPGQILAREDECILVQTADMPMWISEFSSGGESVSASVFTIGQHLNYRVQDQIFELRRALNTLKQMIRS